MSYQCISVEEANALLKNDVTLLDIRDAASFAKGKINGAVHLSDGNVEKILAEADKNTPLLVYCYHGNSSKGAAEFFSKNGFTKTYSVNGGFESWKLLRGQQS